MADELLEVHGTDFGAVWEASASSAAGTMAHSEGIAARFGVLVLP